MTHPSIHAGLTPDKVAYRMADADQCLTYRELEAASNQAAHLFRSLGIRPGDHIALLLQNRLEFLTICWAAQRSGLYCTPISTHLTPGEIAYILDNCAAKLFVADAELADLAGQALPGLSPQAHRLVIGGALEGFADWGMAVGSMPRSLCPTRWRAATCSIRRERRGAPRASSPRALKEIFERQGRCS